MRPDPLLDRFCHELRDNHGCHSLILYGSRAREDATPASDYDLVGIREAGDAVRDARLVDGVYLDAFIYPEAKILAPDASLIHVRTGKVIFEKGQMATLFLQRLQEIFEAGPPIFSADEVQARRMWARKMVGRARQGDLEGNFRRVWLLTALLEDYFVLRGEWYLGPKESFRFLSAERPTIYGLFEAALAGDADMSAIEALVRGCE
ncbi:MAG TPA: nucleotidyltransferase domain-containing protein [Kofleriaceae bacterium]|nr:nucleotidyltransferase domain-containing protein [Kofleriaceae bacterium]